MTGYAETHVRTDASDGTVARSACRRRVASLLLHANAPEQPEKLEGELITAGKSRAHHCAAGGRSAVGDRINHSMENNSMPHSFDKPSFWQRHLDKIGIGGATFAALCCLGFPALLALMSALGIGFLINDAVLLPLLGVSLFITLWGLYDGTRRHHRWSAFGIGVAGAILLVLSILLGKGFYAAAGIAALIVASVLNIILRVRRSSRS